MHLGTILSRPALLKPHQRIFLLGHMRANTSVFGHILGSNPAIAGYYEMHIGYYSRKSFFRQKLLYYQQHKYKPGTKYLFDKVLHTYHFVNPHLLNRKGVKTLITIREPEQTIKSIVSLFRNNFGAHEYQSVDEAFNYYCERVNTLASMAPEIDNYFFFKAEKLKTDTDKLLASIANWLTLEAPLSKEYDQFVLTGKKDSGDKTRRLKTGKLVSGVSDYSAIKLTSEQLEIAIKTYKAALAILTEHASYSIS